jgi:endonuclease YncB( thermonuclease family)
MNRGLSQKAQAAKVGLAIAVAERKIRRKISNILYWPGEGLAGESVRRTFLAFVVGIILSVAAAGSGCGQPIIGVPRIVDADTVEAVATKIRLRGVDAPESDQRCLDAKGEIWNCGLEATSMLKKYVGDRIWTCDVGGTDRCGRFLGACTVDGEDVGRWLVRHGWALAFRRYSAAYVADEDYAREHQLGLWSGAFIPPWEWRHRGPKTVVLGAYQVPATAQR